MLIPFSEAPCGRGWTPPAVLAGTGAPRPLLWGQALAELRSETAGPLASLCPSLGRGEAGGREGAGRLGRRGRGAGWVRRG